MLDIFTTAPTGQAAAWPPEPKEKARPAATPDRPNENKRHTPATVPPDAPSCKCFADVQAQFALLGYTLHTHRTAPGLVHQIRDDDAPKASQKTGNPEPLLIAKAAKAANGSEQVLAGLAGLAGLAISHDAPKPSKASGRTTFIVGHWTGSRHVASWHGVIGLLASLQELARG